MTVVAIIAGLLPIMWSAGTGSEVMQRIAVPMIGGMLSSTILTLVVIPAIYGLVKGWRLPQALVHQTQDQCVEGPERVLDQKS
jgi:Cu(I)/Ag(I) efflux system membrane protein CusA/SilA